MTPLNGAGEAGPMSIVSRFVRSLLELPGMFVDVAAQGPIEALLVLMGALLVGVASIVFGLLAVAAAVQFLTPSSSPVSHRPAE